MAASSPDASTPRPRPGGGGALRPLPGWGAGCAYRLHRDRGRSGGEERRLCDVVRLQIARQKRGSEDVAGARGVDLAGAEGRHVLPGGHLTIGGRRGSPASERVWALAPSSGSVSPPSQRVASPPQRRRGPGCGARAASAATDGGDSWPTRPSAANVRSHPWTPMATSDCGKQPATSVLHLGHHRPQEDDARLAQLRRHVGGGDGARLGPDVLGAVPAAVDVLEHRRLGRGQAVHLDVRRQARQVQVGGGAGEDGGAQAQAVGGEGGVGSGAAQAVAPPAPCPAPGGRQPGSRGASCSPVAPSPSGASGRWPPSASRPRRGWQ